MRLPVLLGPTAVGKTALSIQLARMLGAEIVSADSRQIYRYMDIGTAKPKREELSLARHYMIDLVDPDVHFGAGDFGRKARDAVREIESNGRVPLVVGGSGLYIRALVEGLFKAPPVDVSLRQKILDIADERGKDYVYQRLVGVDPEAAAKIHPNDLQRISRALEVYEQTRRPISQLQKDRKGGHLEPIYFGLTRDRDELHQRIDKRITEMMELGFLEEVAGLLDRGYSASLNSFRAVGYREMADHIDGRVSLDDALARIRKNTRGFARRQLTWFKALKGVHWIHLASPADEAEAVLEISSGVSPSIRN